MAQNTELEQTVQDLKEVARGEHRDSQKYRDLTDSLQKLMILVRSAYDNDRALSQTEHADLIQAYNDVHRACINYMGGKVLPRTSAVGEGRLNCVRELDRIVGRDLAGLSDPEYQTSRRSYREIIQRSRVKTVTLEDPSRVTSVGANMSQRIPLTISDGETSRSGFFTGGSIVEVKQFPDKYRNMSSDPWFIEIFDTARDDVSKRKTLIETFSGMQGRYNTTSLDLVKENLRKTDGFREFVEILATTEEFRGTDVSYLNRMDETARGVFLDMLAGGIRSLDTYTTNTYSARIREGEELSKRNAAMTRVSDMLGFQGLIARSEIVELKENGTAKRGVFMETAPGEDVNHLKADSLLLRHADSISVQNETLMRQISDLQVLDYLCGNVDRHAGNALYRTEEKDGQVVVTGLTGIDNDTSFGEIYGTDKGRTTQMVHPEDMLVMRESTAIEVLSMDGNALELELRDLDMRPEEIAAAKSRLETLQNRLLDDLDYFDQKQPGVVEQGHIRVLSDDQFQTLDMNTLKDAIGASHGSLFVNVAGLADTVQENIGANTTEAGFMPGSDISYAPAAGTPGQHKDLRPVRLEDAAKANEELKTLSEELKKADSRLHRDSASFKWMKTSLAQLTEFTETFAKRAANGEKENLSADDVKKLDDLYRELNKAGSNYLQKHQGNRVFGMGRKRKSLAQSMSSLRAPHSGISAEKKKVNYRELAEKKRQERQPREHGARELSARQAERGASPDQAGPRRMT